MRKTNIPLVIVLLIMVSGRASIAKGVTQTILEGSEEEDTRACHVEGPSSEGLEALMREQKRERAGGKPVPDSVPFTSGSEALEGESAIKRKRHSGVQIGLAQRQGGSGIR